jgi:hypothetical protein
MRRAGIEDHIVRNDLSDVIRGRQVRGWSRAMLMLCILHRHRAVRARLAAPMQRLSGEHLRARQTSAARKHYDERQDEPAADERTMHLFLL